MYDIVQEPSVICDENAHCPEAPVYVQEPSGGDSQYEVERRTRFHNNEAQLEEILEHTRVARARAGI